MGRMTAESYSRLYEAAWKASADTGEPVGGRLAEEFTCRISWTRAVDFMSPVKGHYDIMGIRFLSFRGCTDMYIITHGREAYPAADHVDEEMAVLLAAAARQAAEHRRCHPHRRAWSPEGFAARAEVIRFEEIDRGIYFYQYDDYSGGLVNSLGQKLGICISDYEFILGMRVLGKLEGVTYYAIKCAYCINNPAEYHIFDIMGNHVSFPETGIDNADSLDKIHDEFQKLAGTGISCRNDMKASEGMTHSRDRLPNAGTGKGIHKI